MAIDRVLRVELSCGHRYLTSVYPEYRRFEGTGMTVLCEKCGGWAPTFTITDVEP